MAYELPDVLRIYEEALALDGNALRAAYVESACGGDADLCREVEALLAEPSSPAANLLDTPPWSPSPLEAGQFLGPYEVLGLLGAGGMGAVYRARDTRLKRQVALKVVAGAGALAPAARERLTREAQAVAALEHPHICAIFDVGRDVPTDGGGRQPEAPGGASRAHRLPGNGVSRRARRWPSGSPRDGCLSTRFSPAARRWPRPSRQPTAPASSTATSSRRTSCFSSRPPDGRASTRSCSTSV